MKSLWTTIVCGIAFISVYTTAYAQGQKKKPKGIDAATIAAYKKLGAEYGGWQSMDQFRTGKKYAKGLVPGFRFKELPRSKLPNVSVPFGLFLDCEVEDGRLRELAHLKNLTMLDLYPGLVTDKHLRDLRKIGLLHALRSAEGKDDEVRPKSPKDVLDLELLGTVTDSGLRELRPLRNLVSLSLEETEISDAGLKELRRFKKLQSLILWKTKTTDAGLKELASLKNLDSLDLRGTLVTDAGVKELRKALPKCAISR